jgi:translocator protein
MARHALSSSKKLTMLMHLAVPVSVCFIAAIMGAALTEPNLGWYAGLNKPGITPPNWVFPVVWGLLYATMAGALFWAWRMKGKPEDEQLAFRWFVAFLALNVGWSYAFFQMRNPELGVLVIMLVLLAIIGNIVVFDRLSRGAALLFVPTLLWVSFAAMLNVAIWVMNA